MDICEESAYAWGRKTTLKSFTIQELYNELCKREGVSAFTSSDLGDYKIIIQNHDADINDVIELRNNGAAQILVVRQLQE